MSTTSDGRYGLGPMGNRPPTLTTSYTTLEWSPDGRTVTKTRDRADDAHRRFRNELRINKLLRDEPPPIPTPQLVSHDARRRSLTFEAIPGEPLGPKYPQDLDDHHVGAMVDIADRLHHFEPRRRRWLRRLNSTGRLTLAHRHGLLTGDQATHLRQLARRLHTKYRFGHGDITARNIMLSDEGGPYVLIDWEWAGLYPAGYDHAFLWFSLIDTPGARDRVERHVSVSPESFLLSALLVQLWHLQWFTPPAFRPRHIATRDELLVRLGV